jgi:hypothetical protein
MRLDDLTIDAVSEVVLPARSQQTSTLKYPLRILVFIFFLFLHVGISAQQAVPDLKGTWSGTFVSRNSGIAPFTITVKINKNSSGYLVGDASVVSDCLDSHKLEVTSNALNVVMAGSDAAGDTVSFRGTVDSTGSVLSLHYIINGSPSGRCEIDDGAGTMGKR